MRRSISSIVLLLISVLGVNAQSAGFDFDFIKGKKLEINLVTRGLGTDNETLWHMESNRVAVSGEAVKVKLSGDNLVVIANITPYLNEDNTVFLVAKGEIFLSNNTDSKEVKYYTTLKSLPVKFGETAVFFPLGMAYDSDSNVYSIEMDIQVLSVEDDSDSVRTE